MNVWSQSRAASLLVDLSNADLFSSSRILRGLSRLRFPVWMQTRVERLKLPVCALLAIALPFAPKWELGALGREALFIRADDLLLVCLCVWWLVCKRSFEPTGIDVSLTAFLFVLALSILKGTAVGAINQPGPSLLYFAKMVQFVLVFLLVRSAAAERDHARFLLRVAVYTSLAVGLYGMVESFVPYESSTAHTALYRLYERGFFSHDANHMGAYMMFSASVTLGMALWTNSRRVRAALGAAVLCQVWALMFTMSRTAYVALAASILCLAFARWRRRAVVILLALAVAGFLLAPDFVRYRVEKFKDVLSTSSSDSSFAFRVQRIKVATETFPKHPLLGVGFGARHRVFYENQYLLLLAETGLTGLLAFLWILGGLFFLFAARFQRAGPDAPWLKGAIAGYIAGLIGLMLFGSTCIVFLVSRVAGPFWFLSAVLLALTARGGQGRFRQAPS